MSTSEVVLITGAGRGIGLAATRRFAAAGATVIGTATGDLGLAGLDELAAEYDGRVTGVRLDFLDDTGDSGDTELAQVLSRVTDRVDVLICNAGIMREADEIAEQTIGDWRAVLEVNVTGPFRTIQAALPLLRRAQVPRVITVHGGLGRISSGMEGGGCVAYRVSKAGVAALTLTLTEEGKDSGILACGYDPGWVATDLGGSDAPKKPEECGEELFALAEHMRTDEVSGLLFNEGSPVSW